MKNHFIKQSTSFFIIYLVLVSCGVAQSFQEKKTYTVQVNENESFIISEVQTRAKSPGRTDAAKVYYWYKSNNIMSTRGGYEGKLLHGKYSSFYMNNNLKEKGKFDHGLKTGEWIKWNKDGTIAEISYWKDGALHGKFQEFNAKQELAVRSDYRRGKLHGEVITYDAGQVVSKKRYKNGVEIISKEKTPRKKEEKPAEKNRNVEKIGEKAALQDSTLNDNKKAPAKKVDSSKKEKEKK